MRPQTRLVFDEVEVDDWSFVDENAVSFCDLFDVAVYVAVVGVPAVEVEAARIVDALDQGLDDEAK